MADEKKPDFDPDKTVVDIRRPGVPTPPADADRTIVTPASSVTRPGVPSADDERTMVTPHGGVAPAPGGPQAAAGGDFQLVCLSGHARGKRYPLSGPEVLIGSNPSCQLQFASIDSVHVKLIKQPDGHELQNVGTPGSVVMSGGRKPTRAKLKSGDLVKIKDVVLRYAQVGEVFSAEYDEKQFQGGLGTLFAPENRLYLGLGAAVVVLLLLFLWPSGPSETVVQKQAAPSGADKERQQEISALLQAGEVLFNGGKLLAPPDQPDAENAFAKFNEVLARDPGNEQARSWLKKIDEEHDKQRRARDDAEKARLAQQRERDEQKRRDLEAKIASIVEQGDAYFEKGQVTEPVGTNALAKYREALKIFPESQIAQERVQKASNYYVVRGDELRDKNDLWAALENYRKASRATNGKEDEVERRIKELERQLKSGMAGTTVKLVLYRDEKGQLFVLDDMDKVPARYRDRAVEVQPAQPRPGAEGGE